MNGTVLTAFINCTAVLSPDTWIEEVFWESLRVKSQSSAVSYSKLITAQFAKENTRKKNGY